MTTLNRKYIRPTIWKPRKSQRELHAYFTNLSVNDIYCQPNYKLAEHLGVSIQTAAERVRNHAAIGACKILRELDAEGRIVFSSKGRKPVTRIQLFPEDKWHKPTTKHPRRSPIRAIRTMQESLHGSPTMKESLHGLSSSKDKDLSISDSAAMQESLHHYTSGNTVREPFIDRGVGSAVCSVMEESLHGSVRDRQESAATALTEIDKLRAKIADTERRRLEWIARHGNAGSFDNYLASLKDRLHRLEVKAGAR